MRLRHVEVIHQREHVAAEIGQRIRDRRERLNGHVLVRQIG